MGVLRLVEGPFPDIGCCAAQTKVYSDLRSTSTSSTGDITPSPSMQSRPSASFCPCVFPVPFAFAFCTLPSSSGAISSSQGSLICSPGEALAAAADGAMSPWLAGVTGASAAQDGMDDAERVGDAVSPHRPAWLTCLEMGKPSHTSVQRNWSAAGPAADYGVFAKQIEAGARQQEAVIQEELAEGGDVDVASGSPGASGRAFGVVM